VLLGVLQCLTPLWHTAEATVADTAAEEAAATADRRRDEPGLVSDRRSGNR
jgi:hypothetical protein